MNYKKILSIIRVLGIALIAIISICIIWILVGSTVIALPYVFIALGVFGYSWLLLVILIIIGRTLEYKTNNEVKIDREKRIHPIVFSSLLLLVAGILIMMFGQTSIVMWNRYSSYMFLIAMIATIIGLLITAMQSNSRSFGFGANVIIFTLSIYLYLISADNISSKTYLISLALIIAFLVSYWYNRKRSSGDTILNYV